MNALSERNWTEKLSISLSSDFWLATLASLASSIQMSKKKMEPVSNYLSHHLSSTCQKLYKTDTEWCHAEFNAKHKPKGWPNYGVFANFLTALVEPVRLLCGTQVPHKKTKKRAKCNYVIKLGARQTTSGEREENVEDMTQIWPVSLFRGQFWVDYRRRSEVLSKSSGLLAFLVKSKILKIPSLLRDNKLCCFIAAIHRFIQWTQKQVVEVHPLSD